MFFLLKFIFLPPLLASSFSSYVLFLSFFLFSLMSQLLYSNCMGSFQICTYSSDLMIDSMSFWMVYITVFVFILSTFLVMDSSKVNIKPFVVHFLLVVCVLFFLTSNVFWMYVMFESSLFPISYIILKWGVYSDRSLSVMYMLLYTSLFSFPLMIGILSFFIWSPNMNILHISLIMNYNGLWLVLMFFLAFSVKLPVFGLHYWLPMAHVEAPTLGSMILAGVLLKLGGYGLWRCMFFLFNIEAPTFFAPYFIVSMVLVSLVTSIQSDFKRLVAYSSVVHMTVLIWVVFLSTFLSEFVFISIMVFHGLLSPYLFFLVGMVYKFSKTRLVYQISGILKAYSFGILLMVTLSFLMSVPTPPFPQFIYEVVLFLSSSTFSLMFYFVVVIIAMLSLIYNLVWFIPLVLWESNLMSYISVSMKDELYSCLFICSILFVSFCVMLM